MLNRERLRGSGKRADGGRRLWMSRLRAKKKAQGGNPGLGHEKVMVGIIFCA